MSGAATLPWSAGTWNDCVKSSKSALRWDIKNSMKSLCKRLTEVGEECFIVTVNINNGWVGHFGTLKGDEYIEDRSQIVWDFLKYCRESDCVDSSTNSSTEESDREEEGNQTQDQPGNQAGDQDYSDTTETDEWEPEEWVPEPSQSDRSLRPRDHEKGSRLLITDAVLEKVKNQMKQKRLDHQTLLAANEPSPARQSWNNKPQLPRQSSLNKSPLKRQILYMRSRRGRLRSSRSLLKDREPFKLDLKILTKPSKEKNIKGQLMQCSCCPRVFKHESLYHKHLEFHKTATMYFQKDKVW